MVSEYSISGSHPGGELPLEISGPDYDRASIRPRRLVFLLFGGIGGAMLIAGIWFEIFGSSYFLLIIAGVLVLGAVGWAWTRIPRSSNRLFLSGSRLEFQTIDGKRVDFRWSDPKARLLIYDWRAIPREGRSKGLEGVEFILAPNVAVEAAVNRPSVHAILGEAERQGLSISGWDDYPATSGQVKTIVVSARKQSTL